MRATLKLNGLSTESFRKKGGKCQKSCKPPIFLDNKVLRLFFSLTETSFTSFNSKIFRKIISKEKKLRSFILSSTPFKSEKSIFLQGFLYLLPVVLSHCLRTYSKKMQKVFLSVYQLFTFPKLLKHGTAKVSSTSDCYMSISLENSKNLTFFMFFVFSRGTKMENYLYWLQVISMISGRWKYRTKESRYNTNSLLILTTQGFQIQKN